MEGTSLAVRRESVVLDLQGNFAREAVKDAVAADLLAKSVDRIGGSSTKASTNIDKTSKSVDRLGESTRKSGSDIDKYSTKFGALADAAIILGPTLVPLGATTIPVLTTALAGLGASAAGIGTAILAFKGLGDAVKAIDAYKLAPTIENLAKLRQEEQKFGPAGTQFAAYLSSLEPDLQKLQNTARAGLFPGVEDGIAELLTHLPEVRKVVAQVASGMGDLAREGAQALTSDRFSGFFNYIKSDAEPTLVAFARSAGNVAETVANLLTAFAPLTRGFTGGIEGATAALAKWSQGLDGNTSFQSFLTYLETNGPKVLALLGSLAQTFASIVVAAAPIGQDILPVLTDLSDIIGAIAGSDLGTPILAGVIAMRLFARAQQVIGTEGTSAFGKIEAGQAKVTAGFKNASDSARLFVYDLEKVARYGGLATDSMARLKSTSGTFATFSKGAAGVAGLALATSGLADKIGLGHTASLALLGSIAGPEGTVAGGLVGAVLDLKSANDKTAASQQALNSLLLQSPTAFDAQAQAIDALRQKSNDFYSQSDKDNKTLGSTGIFSTAVWGAYARSVGRGLGVISDSWDASTTKAEADSQRMMVAIATIARGTGDKSVPSPADFTEGRAGNIDTVTGPTQSAASLNTLQVAAAKLKPTLDALGISYADLGNMSQVQLHATAAAIKAYNAQADSVPAKNAAVAAAFHDLNSTMYSTQESAGSVADALNALLSPKLNLSAATDAWAAGLKTLKDDLDKTNKSLVGNSDAALQNRDAIRTRVTDLTAQLSAEAAAGAGAGKLTKTLQGNRQALIDAGTAAGISRSDMVKYLNTLGLTPALVKTVIQANTGQAEGAVKELINGINSLHDRTVTIRMNTVHTDSSGVDYQHGGKPHARGGLITGPGGPTDDQVPIMASNKEYMIRAAAVDYYGVGFFNQVNAMRLAGGGPTSGRSNSPGPNLSWVDVGHGLESTAQALAVFKSALAGSTKALDKAKSAYMSAVSNRDSLAATIASSLGLDSAFNKSAASSNPWMAGASGGQFNVTGNLNAITASADQELADIKTLVGKGVKGAALQALLAQGPELVHAMAQMSAADLSAEVAAYSAASSAIAAVSAYGANVVDGPAVKQAHHDMVVLQNQVRLLNHSLNQAAKDNTKGHKATAHAAATSGTTAASNARRRGRGH